MGMAVWTAEVGPDPRRERGAAGGQDSRHSAGSPLSVPSVRTLLLAAREHLARVGTGDQGAHPAGGCEGGVSGAVAAESAQRG